MANVQWASVGNNVLRDNAYQLNNATGNYERITLLELACTNLVLQSDALATTWTAVGVPRATNAVATAATRPFSSLAFASAWGTDYVKQAITYTGNAVKAFSILMRQNGTDTGTFTFQVFDATGAASKMTVTATVAAGGAITAAASVGTLLKVSSETGGVYRIDCQTASVTAANTNEIRLGTAGTCPSVQISGVQTSDNLVPSSLLPTTTTTVTRNADVAYLDLAGTALAVPREATFYVKFIELGAIAINSSNRVFTIGDTASAGTTTFDCFVTGGTYHAALWSGATLSSIGAVLAPALNDEVELLIHYTSGGDAVFTQAINGVAASPVTTASPLALQASFADTKCYLGLRDAGPSFASLTGLQAFKAIPGNYTLAQMRAL